MRELIAAMKISVDAETEGPEGYADWVDARSDDYGLMSRADARVLGSGLYPECEQYWTTIQNRPPALGPIPPYWARTHSARDSRYSGRAWVKRINPLFESDLGSKRRLESYRTCGRIHLHPNYVIVAGRQ